MNNKDVAERLLQFEIESKAFRRELKEFERALGRVEGALDILIGLPLIRKEIDTLRFDLEAVKEHCLHVSATAKHSAGLRDT